MICRIKNCDGNIFAKNLCNKHYKRLLRNGSPHKTKVEISGYSNHSLYSIRGNILQRCYNKNHDKYKYYGGRDITMCEEWNNSAKAFIEWCLENGWKPGLEIDRKDNDGDYCPENCRFVTRKENVHNQRLLISTNTSGYRGVNYHNKRWYAYIKVDGIKKHLGCYDTSGEAALAYNNAIPDNRPRNIIR